MIDLKVCERGPDGYLQLSEGRGVRFIDTDEGLETFFSCQVGVLCLCALDAEWPPVFSNDGTRRRRGHTQAATLAQLALVDESRAHHFVVIDLMKISPAFVKQHIIQAIFECSDVVKVGYSLWQDVKAVVVSTTSSSTEGGHHHQNHQEELNGLREMSKGTSWVDLQRYHGEFINPRGSALGLTDLTSVLLGCPLNKALQCSAWGDRPLRQDQLEYAALDAACLLDAFGKTVDRVLKGKGEAPLNPMDAAKGLERALNAKYEERASRNRSQNGRGQGKKKKKKKKQGRARGEVESHEGDDLDRADEVAVLLQEGCEEIKSMISGWFVKREEPPKFICDEMLGGLAKQLRSCGLDCELAVRPTSNCDYVREMVETAEREDRILLTSSVRLYQRRLTEQVVLVRTRGRREQLQQILAAFAVSVPDSNLFTRCILCNGRFERCTEEAKLESIAPAIRRKHEAFFECVRCKKVYWEGKKYETAFQGLKGSLEKLTLGAGKDAR
ncbi:Mut7-like exonuclease [Chloropicon primus]|uniref:Mut7-like exonuclease n=1 Tax=Chloropicon primus TaxID=1764295 RepID=A0A5B8MDB5_9CHLO|nr:Mut7-like exonuclease [Chloropicon primus]UPQ97627.1 Mut7-like exonuclease [Chloropicon primus]|mmetsp:Transcript_2989/g.8104  ORF Transcript_2989/g.8104 Transcript_2989/m.8104 type:complete len:499 (+) Transcript_2989:42-1538(+)|eukprot:QDZ18417.1 Mut7-like exonuclease [Chloropicon primus]